MHKLMHTLHTRTHTHTNKLATVLHMIVDLKISLKVFWRYCLFLPIVMWVGGGGGHERTNTVACFGTSCE